MPSPIVMSRTSAVATSIQAVSPVSTSVRPRDQRAHCATGVTARSSVSPVRIRTTRSSGTTKILPSPTSPVWPPSHSASIVGCDELVGDGDLEADLLRQAHLHAHPAVGLDALQLAAVALHAAHREAAHLRAVQRFEHVVGLVRPHDPDHELHSPHLSTPSMAPVSRLMGERRRALSPRPKIAPRLWPGCTTIGPATWTGWRDRPRTPARRRGARAACPSAAAEVWPSGHTAAEHERAPSGHGCPALAGHPP